MILRGDNFLSIQTILMPFSDNCRPDSPSSLIYRETHAPERTAGITMNTLAA